MLGIESRNANLTTLELYENILEKHFGPPADIDHEILESVHNALPRILSPMLGEFPIESSHFLLVLQPAKNATRTFSLSITFNRDQISLVLNRYTLTYKPCDVEIYKTFTNVFEISVFLEGDRFDITTPISDSERNRIIMELSISSNTEAIQDIPELLENRNLRKADLSGVCAIIKCLIEDALQEDI